MSSEPPIGFERPPIEPITDAKKRKFSTAPPTSALTDEIALPTLRDSSSASSLRFAAIASASACSRRERSFGGVRPHGPVERGPRGLDRAVDVGLAASATRASGSPVAGSRSSRVSPAAGSTVSPLMKRPCSLTRRDRHEPENTGCRQGSARATMGSETRAVCLPRRPNGYILDPRNERRRPNGDRRQSCTDP